MRLIRVSSKSDVKKVAGSIAKMFRENYIADVEIQAVGAAAVNQAVKSIAIAEEFLKEDSISLFFKVKFINVDFNGVKESGILFRVEANLVRD